MTRLKRVLESVKQRKDINKSDKDRAEKEYGDTKFADPVNKKYPIDTEEHIRAAWNYINHENCSDKYDTKSLRRIMMNIIGAWEDKIDPDGPPSI